MDNQYKIFHFQEIDWLVYFPLQGNKGKYLGYNVVFKERKNGVFQPGKLVKLGEILENREFEQRYPHTVGYFKVASENGDDFKPEYLELREIKTVEEFWFLLNSLNI